MTSLLAVSGSLRAVSTNTALLEAMARAAPASVSVGRFDGLGSLPIFNPDLEGEATPQSVLGFAGSVAAADGLIIACPEYAHGIPGGLKNALDWLVSRDEIPFKPVMLVRASHRNAISHAALEEVLRTMSVRLMAGADVEVPLLGKSRTDVERILDDADVQRDLRAALERFARFTHDH